MGTFLTDVDAWLTAAGLMAAMLAGWAVRWWRGRRLAAGEREAAPNKFAEATLALLGLLLAFTFSMALVKHDQRRQMVVADSNAIGDFYTCASLLKEPVRGKLQALVRQYAEHRLALAQGPADEATLQHRLAEVQEMHGRMQAMVGEAVDGGTPVAIPLVNTLNALTSNHAARLAALRDRLPGSIVLLLLLAAVTSLAVVGEQRQHGSTIGFVVLVGMVVWVTLDLNQPERGFIRVSQEPLQRLLSGMGK
jgi:hypothetical protein